MRLSIYHTHTHSLGHMSEREVVGTRERDYYCREIILLFLGFTFGADSISKEFEGFSPLLFSRGKFFVPLVSCVFIAVHVILSVKEPKIIMLA